MCQLIIAEKPSIAKHIARALNLTNKKNGYISGDDYIVTWAYGHLLELLLPEEYDIKYANWDLQNYPFIPTEHLYKVKSSQPRTKYKSNSSRQQLSIIESLINTSNIESIILATDWDREGQIIGDSILTYANNTKPVYRLLLNEWTEEAIIQALGNMVDNSTLSNLCDAGYCRQHFDWEIGMNLSPVFTLTQRQEDVLNTHVTYNIGRVILPTLKILYDRYMERRNFIPEETYRVNVELDILGSLQHPSVLTTLSQAQKLQHTLAKAKHLTITDISETIEKIFSLPLFSLTSLQMCIINKYNGWTAEKVLRICQSLYDQQYITYPRTDSEYLPLSTKTRTMKTLNVMKKNFPEFQDSIKFHAGKTIFDDTKVKSHGAIVPTTKSAVNLNDDEYLIYFEILLRFLSKFMPPTEKHVQNITGIIANETFRTKLTLSSTLGWEQLYMPTSNSISFLSPTSTTNFSSSVPLQIGDQLNINKTDILRHVSKPPNDYTEATLLHVMEYCGEHVNDAQLLQGYTLGTPATRGDILRKIKEVGYVQQVGKFLHITSKTIRLVERFPIPFLLDKHFTGYMEHLLHEVEHGKMNKDDFITFSQNLVKESVRKIQMAVGTKYIWQCPLCGNYITAGEHGYGCLGYFNETNKCNSIILRTDIEKEMGIQLTDELMQYLLKHKSINFTYPTDPNQNQYVLYLDSFPSGGLCIKLKSVQPPTDIKGF